VSTLPAWAPPLEVTTLTLPEPGVAVVTLNRPEAANSRNQQMRRELASLWAGIAGDDDIRAVVLTAAGDRFFCAGMDLKEAGGAESPDERRERLRSSRDIEQLAALPQPVVAAVNGYALGGGCEMALACDLRVMADGAHIGLTELAHGLVPGGGGTQRLPRLVGVARATELLLLGRRLDGPAAVAAGLATRSVPLDALPETAMSIATSLAAMPTRAVRAAKELLRKSQEVPLSVGIDLELDTLLGLMADRATSA
jgi:enoyl-CoA hydratase/carnithine racemase